MAMVKCLTNFLGGGGGLHLGDNVGMQSGAVSDNVGMQRGAISDNVGMQRGAISDNVGMQRGAISDNVGMQRGAISGNVGVQRGAISDIVGMQHGAISDNVGMQQGAISDIVGMQQGAVSQNVGVETKAVSGNVGIQREAVMGMQAGAVAGNTGIQPHGIMGIGVQPGGIFGKSEIFIPIFLSGIGGSLSGLPGVIGMTAIMCFFLVWCGVFQRPNVALPGDSTPQKASADSVSEGATDSATQRLMTRADGEEDPKAALGLYRDVLLERPTYSGACERAASVLNQVHSLHGADALDAWFLKPVLREHPAVGSHVLAAYRKLPIQSDVVISVLEHAVDRSEGHPGAIHDLVSNVKILHRDLQLCQQNVSQLKSAVDAANAKIESLEQQLEHGRVIQEELRKDASEMQSRLRKQELDIAATSEATKVHDLRLAEARAEHGKLADRHANLEKWGELLSEAHLHEELRILFPEQVLLDHEARIPKGWCPKGVSMVLGTCVGFPYGPDSERLVLMHRSPQTIALRIICEQQAVVFVLESSTVRDLKMAIALGLDKYSTLTLSNGFRMTVEYVVNIMRITSPSGDKLGDRTSISEAGLNHGDSFCAALECTDGYLKQGYRPNLSIYPLKYLT